MNCALEVCDLARMRPERPLEEYGGVVTGGPLHAGKLAPQLANFVSENLPNLNDRPSTFFTLSLPAAGTEEQQNNATRCQELAWSNRTSRHAGRLGIRYAYDRAKTKAIRRIQ